MNIRDAYDIVSNYDQGSWREDPEPHQSERDKLFGEPEGWYNPELYPNGKADWDAAMAKGDALHDADKERVTPEQELDTRISHLEHEVLQLKRLRHIRLMAKELGVVLP